MEDKYKVIEIYEMDFGCEGRAEGMKDMVQVRLRSSSGEVITIQASDASLYEQDIVEGTEVFLSDGRLKKYSEIC